MKPDRKPLTADPSEREQLTSLGTASEDPPPATTARKPFRHGELCGICGLGILDYNGLLDLECPVCGYTEGPGGGCT